jgi:hypothetical protein
MSKGVPLESGYEECGHSCAYLSQHGHSTCRDGVAAYVVHRDKFSFVLEHHHLILRITANFRVFPIIDRYLSGFGAVVARHVEHAASRDMLLAARALFADARGVVKIWIRRHCTGAKPRVTSLR